jgi:hypothetical protein
MKASTVLLILLCLLPPRGLASSPAAMAPLPSLVLGSPPLPGDESIRGLCFATGFDTVESLVSFTLGWASNTQFNGGSDQEWQDFLDWLDEVKHELPPEGWHVKYLRDCGGDHERAALKFLDFAAEFVALRRKTPAS